MVDPGWYYAEGDPLGTTRYWDGEVWIGDPVAGPHETAGGYDLIAPAEAPLASSYGAFDVVAGKDARANHERQAAQAANAAYELPKPEYQSGLTNLVVWVTILKAIPLVFSVALLFWLRSKADEIDFGGGPDFQDFIGAAIVIILIVYAIAAALLALQLVGALAKQPMMVFVVAVILTLFDLYSTYGAATSGSILALLIMLPVLAMQALVAFWSFTFVFSD